MTELLIATLRSYYRYLSEETAREVIAEMDTRSLEILARGYRVPDDNKFHG